MDDGLDFSPLSNGEIEAAKAQAQDGEPVVQTPTLPPPDAEPADAAAARMFGRPPDMLWPYLDAHGELAFAVCRWSKRDGGKDIRPLSWFVGGGWRFGAWPNDRPLYKLHEITAKPNAAIVVCEGERAADAAARIFPKSVAVTSSGGSQAAAKSDWTPLANRKTMPWPDGDEAGAKYAREVAKILFDLGCAVSVVDAGTLAAIGPNGGKRESAKGWDAADAVDEWEDVGALRTAAMGLAKPFDPGPAYVSHGPFDMQADGLWCTVPGKSKKDGGEGEVGETWLSGPFEIRGRARDENGGKWARFLRFKDSDGREHTATVSDADLHGDASALSATLAHSGLRIATGRGSREKFVAYLNGASVRARVTTVDRTGWSPVNGSAVFVLPAGAIGAPVGETVLLQGGATAAYGAKGTLEGWRETIGERVATHSRAVLALSVAVAGPLLHLTGQDGFGVNLFGSSSRGKTTLLQGAASVWSPPPFVKGWRSTANALEASAALASDTLLCLDEIGALDAREAGATVYALSNGVGKGRAARDGGLRESKSWRVLTLSSGELPMSAKVAEGGKRAMAGQGVRMIDIQADAGRGFGCFDHGAAGGDAGAISNAIKSAARENYGTVGPEFVRRMVADGVDGVADDCKAAIAEFVKANVERGADG